MHDALAVGVVERPRAVEDDLDDLVNRQQIIRRTIGLEGMPALDILHDDKPVIAVNTDIIDIDDIRVVQHAGGMRLVKEHLAMAGAGFGVVQGLGIGDLDRDPGVDIRIMAQINGAHIAAANLFADFVFAELFRG